MDFKTIVSTFGIIFLAELGDKTQLSVLLFSAKSQRPASVCLGACLALVVTTVIATVLGSLGKEFVPTRLLHYIAAVGFIGIGIWMFLTKS